MEKFHFNPLPLNETTREYFPYLQTLYKYYSDDNLFLDDRRIIARKRCKLPFIQRYNLDLNEIKQLEEWTKLKCSEVIFDSDIDNWSKDTSVFDEKLLCKRNFALIVEDTKNNKFGYYFDGYIDRLNRWTPPGPNTFLFSLQSNGRINGMMKFEMKKLKGEGFFLPNKRNQYLFGNYINNAFVVLKQYKDNQSRGYCFEREYCFNYHGIEKALCGKTYSQSFTPKRIVVIQMEYKLFIIKK